MIPGMRYLELGLLLGLLASSCGDDSTGTDTSVASTGSGGTSSGETSSGGDDVNTTGGMVSSESSVGGTSSSGGPGTTAGSDDMGPTNGTSVGETGTGGTFPCGEEVVCLVDTQYCQQTVGGAIGNPPSYTCMDLPNECIGDATCDCLSSVPCGRICEMVESGVQVTCQAP